MRYTPTTLGWRSEARPRRPVRILGSLLSPGSVGRSSGVLGPTQKRVAGLTGKGVLRIGFARAAAACLHAEAAMLAKHARNGEAGVAELTVRVH
jgi:hypothetical protein